MSTVFSFHDHRLKWSVSCMDLQIAPLKPASWCNAQATASRKDQTQRDAFDFPLMFPSQATISRGHWAAGEDPAWLWEANFNTPDLLWCSDYRRTAGISWWGRVGTLHVLNWGHGLSFGLGAARQCCYNGGHTDWARSESCVCYRSRSGSLHLFPCSLALLDRRALL